MYACIFVFVLYSGMSTCSIIDLKRNAADVTIVLSSKKPVKWTYSSVFF